MKVEALNAGWVSGSAAIWRQGEDPEKRIRFPVPAYLVETDSERILIDTGLHPGACADGVAFYGGSPTMSLFSLELDQPVHEQVDATTITKIVLTHLHYDHAGGLLQADGSRAFPRARIVAQRQEWEFGLGTNSRLVASYDQPELRLVADWGAQGWVDGERELLPGVSVVRTGGHSAGHQAIVVRGTGPGARSVAFFGDLAMRPWSANPRWVTAFDDFPLDSVEVKGELFRRAVEDDWMVVLSHEVRMPVGRLVPDRDRFRFEGL